MIQITLINKSGVVSDIHYNPDHTGALRLPMASERQQLRFCMAGAQGDSDGILSITANQIQSSIVLGRRRRSRRSMLLTMNSSEQNPESSKNTEDVSDKEVTTCTTHTKQS